MNEREEIDTRIVKFLSGETTAEETMELKEWIESSDAHRAHFEAMEQAFYMVPDTQQSFDTNQAWQVIQQQLDERDAKVVRMSPWKMWTAAAIIVALGCTWWWVYNSQPDMQWAAQGHILQHELPNGISMTLRENTTASLTEDEHDVAVQLDGEAYFDIPHHTVKPFFVKTESVVIRDIGTAFRVRSIASEDSMYFNVDEGIIVCYANLNDSLRLEKGQSGYYCRSTRQLGIRKARPNESAFATKKLVYENASMADVIRDLQWIYGVQIVVQETQMQQCSISVAFDRQRIEEIMEVIAITMNWTAEWDGQQWNVKGAPCQQPL